MSNLNFLLKYFLMIFKIWFISNIGQQFYRCSHATLLRSNSKVNLAHCCVCEYLLFLPVPSCLRSSSVIYNVCVLINLIWGFHSCTVKKTRITFTALTLCVFLHFRWGGDFVFNKVEIFLCFLHVISHVTFHVTKRLWFHKTTPKHAFTLPHAEHGFYFFYCNSEKKNDKMFFSNTFSTNNAW